jgi:penicillin-binding protein 1C
MFNYKILNIISRVGLGLVGIFIFLQIMNFLFPLPEPKTFSKEILAEDGTLLTAYLTKDQKWRMKTSVDEVSPELLKALISKEDKYFHWHLGVNPISIFRAFYNNMVNGKITSGASTITMQLARILEPANRNYLSKIKEAFRAIQLELLYPKNEILEMYINYLPYGGNIEGVRAASFIYFNHPPNKLSLAQAISLCVIPNAPNKLRLDRNVKQTIIKRDTWINRFLSEQIFREDNLIDAENEPMQQNRFEIPKLAPHFSQRVSEKFDRVKYHTSLDLKMQNRSERLLLNYVKRIRSKNISNGSVIVIDNENNNVVAYCGSADFFDNKSSGQVDGIIATRSPGSTLKPFLFAQAFDKGILTPKMKLLDIPTDFSGYEPENYDNEFNGEVTAEFALMNSLNIPAVYLLQKINLPIFLQNMNKLGFSKIYTDKEKLGLSVILGGCGTSLEELVRAYTAFSNDGEIIPIKYLTNSVDQNSNKVFSSASAYLTTNILSNIERPDFPNNFVGDSKLPKIAWKTGTSYGKRDAWAIGMNPRYTIGVWLGNFSGEGSPYLSGAEMAVPLLFELFNALDYDSDKKWYDKPYKILEREVCSESGLLASENCENQIFDYFIEDVSTHKRCDRNKVLMVNTKKEIEYCPNCLESIDYEKVSYPNFDAGLKLWYKKNNVEFSEPPKHNPECNYRLADEGPKIVSPLKNYDYFLDEKSTQKILLQAISAENVLSQYWYINNSFYKKCKPGEKVFFRPEDEIVNIVCADDKGGMSKLNISVKYY